MKVYVIMGNDYPESVCDSEQGARELVAKYKAEDKAKAERPDLPPRIFWRYYPFELKRRE